MPVSIKDIAQKAGVSPSTVSRALNDHPRISQETKTYIQNLARSMGYIPSTVARNLVTRRTATIGVAIADLTDPYYGRLMLGIDDAAAAHNYQVLLSCFYRDPDRELALVHDFHKRRVDGIIVLGSEAESAYSDPDQNFFMPIVLVNRPGYRCSVSVDRNVGGQMVVDYLVSLGHRRIAFITGGARQRIRSRRLAGYRQALARHHIPYNPDLVVDGDGEISGGIRAANQLLSLSPPPTAVFCFNDMTAIGVINALRRQGFRVPDDFSVVGFDDLEMTAYYSPALTTVRQPTHEVGERAFDMLSRLIRHQPVEPEMLNPELVIRASTTSAAQPLTA
ncbi:MAG: LacI family transcriptional regulator [Chloroflexi bacterium]|nr:MAG: LacI family transcriptional regulator [Chloroflexota bacterium]